jgi:hypothetical protein
VADGLFHVDVLARLQGPDRQQRVRVVRGRDRDGVDRLVLDQFAEVLVEGGFLALLLLDGLHGLAEDVFVHVADRGDFDALEGQERLDVVQTPAADARDGDAEDVVAGREGPGAQRGRRGDRRGMRQEPPAR